jgi:hypothetical protein
MEPVLHLKPTPFRIDQIDMYERDERAYKILQEHRNPETHRAEIKLHELAGELRCSTRTVGRMMRRLSGAGRIKVHRTQGQQGADIEVLSCPPSATTKTT